MRVLVVEDEAKLSEALSEILRKNGYEVERALDGQDGLDYASTGIYDVIVLDVLMPKLNGFEVLTALRKKKITTPVIMLTALADVDDRINGLDCGADDYLPKPFSVDELLARLRALTRRHAPLVIDNALNIGNTTLNLLNYDLRCKDNSVKLSQKEFEIMRYLMERPDFVAVKDDLISKVWGLDSEFESNNLEVYVSFLRKKLLYLNSDLAIESVRGVGYRLNKQAK